MKVPGTNFVVIGSRSAASKSKSKKTPWRKPRQSLYGFFTSTIKVNEEKRKNKHTPHTPVPQSSTSPSLLNRLLNYTERSAKITPPNAAPPCLAVVDTICMAVLLHAVVSGFNSGFNFITNTTLPNTPMFPSLACSTPLLFLHPLPPPPLFFFLAC